jgi:hypothetical protein
MDMLNKLKIPDELLQELKEAPSVRFPKDKNDLIELALGGKQEDVIEVKYETPGKGELLEATVVRCINGVAVNYPDSYIIS